MKEVSISSLSVSTPFIHMNIIEPTALGIEDLGISLDPCPQKTGNRLLIQKLSCPRWQPLTTYGYLHLDLKLNQLNKEVLSSVAPAAFQVLDRWLTVTVWNSADIGHFHKFPWTVQF